VAKVLIVEDDKVLNNAYEMILEKDGHTVKAVLDGQQALDTVDDLQPDIILLDLLMPNVGGITFLENYDVKSKHANVKVIVLSNMGDEKLVERAKELGAYKYVVKAHTTPGQLSLMVNRLSNAAKSSAEEPA
jgi:DNA-binding response OmpR family regulator